MTFDDDDTEYCDPCALSSRVRQADFVTTDLDRVCFPCGRELAAEVQRYLP